MSNRRQELYDRIRASSKGEVIREEMVRLGFWKPKDGTPEAMTNEWLEKRAELTKEINALAQKQRKYENREAMLREMRQRRMADARRRREETKERHEAERKARAEAWEERKQNDILYLGEGVSAGLHGEGAEASPADPTRFGLPAIRTVKELSEVLGVGLGELRFLSFHRKVSRVSHYRRFFMPKKSGGKRLISAPMPRLKALQYRVLEKFLEPVPVHDAAHGFVPGRSILTNASAHTGRDLVVNLDLKDFFPSVSFRRTKGLFRALGYPEKIATILGLICTEADTDEVELDGERYFLHRSERRLPQGAPTSPAITNILCYRLDRRLQGVAQSLGYTYTRYADDLTFSVSGEPVTDLKRLLWRIRSVVQSEGFQLHPDKTRIMRRGRQQEVTGLTVNDGVSVPRRDLRNFRALLHRIEKDGLSGRSWRGSSANLLSAIRGYAYFVRMVHPEKGESYVTQVQNILEANQWQHVIRHPRKAPAASDTALPKKKSFLQKLLFWRKG